MTFTAKETQTGEGEDSDPSSRGWLVHKLLLWVAFLDAGEGTAAQGRGPSLLSEAPTHASPERAYPGSLVGRESGQGTMQSDLCPQGGAPAPLSSV